MYEYTCDGAAPESSQIIWSRSPLQPFSDILMPFSYSVLAEISQRAWFRYYQRLGLDLPQMPRQIMRPYFGRPYLNIKWICERDAELAGLEPMVFRINREPTPVCQQPKSGLLGGLRQGRRRRKVHQFHDVLMDEIDGIEQSARTWYHKVMAMHWSQAEILQIMEEIERFGVDSLMAFYAARHPLERAYNQLLRMTQHNTTAEQLQLINNTLSDLQGLVELALTDELLVLANLARQDQAVLDWLAQDEFGDWQAEVPAGEFGQRLGQFMQRYGHWATGEGEMANPRWFERPRFVFKGILACVERGARKPGRIPSASAVQQVLAAVDPDQRGQAETLLQRIRTLSVLQSRALNAFAYILAGTRHWALAAGREAMGDERIRSLDEPFLLELEELKQMMTGEWNVTDQAEIRTTIESRRADYESWQKAQPGDLLFDDAEAYPVHTGLPAVVGQAIGPLRRMQGLQPILCEDAVVGTRQLDSGWTPTLPVAGGLIAAAGTPLDPIVAAARVWHVPAVVALGPHYDGLVDGAQTSLDGGRGAIEQ